MLNPFLSAFLGGLLIGFAAVLMLLFNGRILGVSGIVGGLFQRPQRDSIWRWAFLGGMGGGGLLHMWFTASEFQFGISRSIFAIVVAGLLVGYGTRVGSGCTSGHGVCGVSRLSPRSLVSTLLFMFFGALTVFIIQKVFGGMI